MMEGQLSRSQLDKYAKLRRGMSADDMMEHIANIGGFVGHKKEVQRVLVAQSAHKRMVFESVVEACGYGFTESGIRYAIHSGCRHGGYRWAWFRVEDGLPAS
jgi:hypothetical protein